LPFYGDGKGRTVKVVSLSEYWKDELPALLDAGIDFVVVDAADKAALAAALADAEVLITTHFAPEMAALCKHLRLLVCPAAGTEGIDRAALAAGVRLISGTGHEIPMAEYVIGALVALRQHFFDADAALRRGEWKYGFLGSAGPHEELYGSALGLIGFGSIGQAVARRALAFGMRCAAVTLDPKKHLVESTALEFLGRLASGDDVDRLVGWSDELVLCCELSDVTRGLIDARRFGLMKREALVVNVARGEVAREKDFYDALASGRIAGAAIDVWYRYPPEKHAPSQYPFSDLHNVIMTPHSSGWSEQARQRRGEAMARAINEFARSGERA
jgi:phosphoglycerate dehydrogenase-like enzyme